MGQPLDRKSDTLSFLVELARDCCRLALQVQRTLVVEAISKEDRSPVTVADFAVQALAALRLARRFPETPLLGEESGDLLRTPHGRETASLVARFVADFEPEADPESVAEWIDRGAEEGGDDFWVLDPIDGTKGFLRNAQYAVAIARVTRGKVRQGVLGCPRLALAEGRAHLDARPSESGTLAAAAEGEGAWLVGLDGDGCRRLRVSEVAIPTEAVLLRSVEGGHTNLDQLERLAARWGISARQVAVDSQAKYVVLAAGQADLLVRLLSERNPEYREKIWDQAAGALILEEAGGRITDLDGRPLDFSKGRTLAANRGILATNGLLHEAVLDALRECR